MKELHPLHLFLLNHHYARRKDWELDDPNMIEYTKNIYIDGIQAYEIKFVSEYFDTAPDSFYEENEEPEFNFQTTFQLPDNSYFSLEKSASFLEENEHINKVHRLFAEIFEMVGGIKQEKNISK